MYGLQRLGTHEITSMKFWKSFCTEDCCSIHGNKIITWKTWDFSREEVFTFLFLLLTGLVRDPRVMALTK